MSCWLSTSTPTAMERRSTLGSRGAANYGYPNSGIYRCLLNPSTQQHPLQSTQPHVAFASVASTATNFQQAPHQPLSISKLAEELQQYVASAATSAAAGLQHSDDQSFLSFYLAELSRQDRLRSLRPRQLASLLRSLVHLGLHPGDDWLADLDACCYCHPGPFDPASATTVMQSLALLHAASISSSTSGASTTPASSDEDAATHTAAPRQPKSDRRVRIDCPSNRVDSRRSSWSRLMPDSSRGSSGRIPAAACAATQTSSMPMSLPPPLPQQRPNEIPPGAFRFPYAVYLRLLQGGVNKYSYEQLATLLQSFRFLGVPVTDELAAAVGSRMAAQLLEMEPERRQRALAAALASG